MSKFQNHPATMAGSYKLKNGWSTKPKDRRATIEQNEDKKRLNKLRKKRRK